MEHREIGGLDRRRDEQVRDLASTLMPRDEKALDLSGAAKLFARRLDEFEDCECFHQTVPLRRRG